MTAGNPYHDKREQFFRSYFEKGFSYEDYLRTGDENHRQRWEELATNVSLTAAQKAQLANFKRKMNVVVMSGIWCGDCVRQGPMLRAIERENSLLTFRYLDNRENPELQEELRINGAEKVPVVVTFSEDFYELGCFGDRHLSVYRRKVETELGAACDPGILPPEGDALSVELGEWVNYFERLQLMLRLAPALRKRYND